MSAATHFDAVQILEGRFPDFDALAEAVSGWDLEFRQVDAGAGCAELKQILAPGVQLTRVRLERAYDQQGASPPGMRTFAMLERRAADVTWCGRRFSTRDFCSFADADGFDASSGPGFDVWTLSFSDELLSRRAEELGRPDLMELLGEPSVRGVEAPALDALRASLEPWRWGGDGEEAPPSGALTHDVPYRVLGTLATVTERPGAAPARLRDRAFERARQYVLDEGASRPNVQGMRAASGASWRTLDYAFRERLGVTPQAYLKAVRLDRLRRALRAAPPGTRIVDLAVEQGFNHMGQLAADYRAQFGELPSQTLAANPPGPV